MACARRCWASAASATCHPLKGGGGGAQPRLHCLCCQPVEGAQTHALPLSALLKPVGTWAKPGGTGTSRGMALPPLRDSRAGAIVRRTPTQHATCATYHHATYGSQGSSIHPVYIRHDVGPAPGYHRLYCRCCSCRQQRRRRRQVRPPALSGTRLWRAHRGLLRLFNCSLESFGSCGRLH